MFYVLSTLYSKHSVAYIYIIHINQRDSINDMRDFYVQ